MPKKNKLDFKYDVGFFRSAITLDNFAALSFQTQFRNSEIIRNIVWHSNVLKDSLFRAE